MMKWFLYVLTLALISFVSGCATIAPQTSISTAVTGEQAQVLQSYLDDIAHGKFTDAYDLIATSSKKQMSKEDFVTYYKLGGKLQKITSFKIMSGSILGNTTSNSVQYQDAYQFQISETFQSIPGNKENTVSGQLKVVKEDGTWKVLRESNKTIKQMISQSYANLGWNSGPDKPTETISNFNEAIKYDPNNVQAYLGFSVLELQLKGYEKAISYANEGLAKAQDPAVKSQLHSVLGQVYLDETDLANAEQFFSLALTENPNNSTAQQGINDIKNQK